MKAFQVDEAHWYAGETAEQAVAAYLADIGDEGREYVLEYGEPTEITNMDLLITDVDEPGQPMHRLGDVLAEMTKPGFLATTEY